MSQNTGLVFDKGQAYIKFKICFSCFIIFIGVFIYIEGMKVIVPPNPYETITVRDRPENRCNVFEGAGVYLRLTQSNGDRSILQRCGGLLSCVFGLMIVIVRFLNAVFTKMEIGRPENEACGRTDASHNGLCDEPVSDSEHSENEFDYIKPDKSSARYSPKPKDRTKKFTKAKHQLKALGCRKLALFDSRISDDSDFEDAGSLPRVGMRYSDTIRDSEISSNSEVEIDSKNESTSRIASHESKISDDEGTTQLIVIK